MSDWIRSSVRGLRVVGAAINLADTGCLVWTVALGAAWGHILFNENTWLRLYWIAAQGRLLRRNGRLAECGLCGWVKVWLGIGRSGGFSVRNVRVRDSAGKLWTVFCGSAANLRVCVSSGLSLGGGVGLCDFTFFAAGGRFGNSGDFGPTGGFQAFGCGCPGGFFSLAQRAPPVGVRVIGIRIECDLRCVACGGICGCGCVFGFGLSQ
jgi:hypothetical protein